MKEELVHPESAGRVVVDAEDAPTKALGDAALELSFEGGRYILQYEAGLGKRALAVMAGPHADDLRAARIVAHAFAVLDAAKRHIATHPVYRSKPTGFEGSIARLEQQDRIASEDALLALIAKAEGR